MDIKINLPKTWVQRHGWSVAELREKININLRNKEIARENHQRSSSSDANETLRDALAHADSFINEYQKEIQRIEAGGEILREIHTFAVDMQCPTCKVITLAEMRVGFYGARRFGFFWHCTCGAKHEVSAPICDCCPGGPR